MGSNGSYFSWVPENLAMPLQVVVHAQRTGEIHESYSYDTGTLYISCLFSGL